MLLEAQKQQMANLKMKFEAENKELKQSQTKKSMDDTKAIQQVISFKDAIFIVFSFRTKVLKRKQKETAG